MLSKRRIQYIRSLDLKKNRKAEGVFLAEGPKLMEELTGHFPCKFIVATRQWLDAHRHNLPCDDISEVSEEELARASLLKTPQQVLAVFRQPEDGGFPMRLPSRQLCLALDGVQDPGVTTKPYLGLNLKNPEINSAMPIYADTALFYSGCNRSPMMQEFDHINGNCLYGDGSVASFTQKQVLQLHTQESGTWKEGLYLRNYRRYRK